MALITSRRFKRDIEDDFKIKDHLLKIKLKQMNVELMTFKKFS